MIDFLSYNFENSVDRLSNSEVLINLGFGFVAITCKHQKLTGIKVSSEKLASLRYSSIKSFKKSDFLLQEFVLSEILRH